MVGTVGKRELLRKIRELLLHAVLVDRRFSIT